jgi:hypothetical protein
MGQPSRRGRKDYSETEFGFLQRADHLYWARVRSLIDGWFADFPANRRDHIEKRLRSQDFRQFIAGFWELYLYELLKGAGLNVEVLKEAKSRTPDFKVTIGLESFFVEATIVSGINDREQDAERRRGVLLDGIDSLKSDRFTLDVHVDEDGDDLLDDEGRELPALQSLRTDLLDRLARLNRGALAGELAADSLLIGHAWTWKEAGWNVTFTPELLPEESLVTHSVPLVGSLSHGPVYVVRDDRLRNKLLDKLEHYQGRFQPLLIAVHLDNPFASRRELAGVFGWPMELSRELEVVRSEFEQLPGVFFTERGRDLGGLALITEFRPWNVSRAQAHLWLSPNASRPLSELDVWPTHEFELPIGPSRLVSSGRPPHLLLGLPEDWPGPEGPFDSSE